MSHLGFGDARVPRPPATTPSPGGDHRPGRAPAVAGVRS